MAMAMAPAVPSTSSILFSPSKTRLSTVKSPHFRTSSRSRIQLPIHCTTNSSSVTSTADNGREKYEESMNIDNLHRFIQLNLGYWTGSFYQFDPTGKLMHHISTKLAASSYGEAELISLIQTLYIKQPTSGVFISGEQTEEAEWAEYKIKESNMFTVDKYQQYEPFCYHLPKSIMISLQISFFPKQRAFALRYQTAGMLEYVLRQGVLGEDDTGEEFPRNLMLPSRRPAIVCENCLHSLEKDMRARAFHIMDPKGIVDMLLIFLEKRVKENDIPPSLESESSEDNMKKILPFLGHWKGYSVTKRSGVYGATIAEHDIVASLEMDDNGQLIQDVNSTAKGSNVTTNVHWTGTLLSNNEIVFDKGYRYTLLPGGMYMGCPCDIAKSVKESMCFHLEFCWIESAGKRQRLVRTYDSEGMAVSSTYYDETKV